MDILLQLIVNGLIAGSIYALFAISFNFVFAATRFFNLAHGSIAVVGAYVVFYLNREVGFELAVSLVLGVLAAALCGILIDRVVYHRLKLRGGSPMILLVASLGVMIVVHSILAILFTSNFTTITGRFAKTHLELFGTSFTSVQLTIFILSIVVSTAFFFFLRYTKFGKVVSAVSDDEEVSRIVGINADKVMAQVFFLGSGLAGLGGILFALDTGIDPSMDMLFLLKGVIAAIVGGIGNIYGALIGAIFIGLVENLGIWYIPSEWKDTIAFAILVIFLVFRPYGILGKR